MPPTHLYHLLIYTTYSSIPPTHLYHLLIYTTYSSYRLLIYTTYSSIPPTHLYHLLIYTTYSSIPPTHLVIFTTLSSTPPTTDYNILHTVFDCNLGGQPWYSHPWPHPLATPLDISYHSPWHIKPHPLATPIGSTHIAPLPVRWINPYKFMLDETQGVVDNVLIERRNEPFHYNGGSKTEEER